MSWGSAVGWASPDIFGGGILSEEMRVVVLKWTDARTDLMVFGWVLSAGNGDQRKRGGDIVFYNHHTLFVNPHSKPRHGLQKQ